MKQLILLLLFSCLAALSFAGIEPTQLTCEYLKNPSVVDVRQPRLAWINVAKKAEYGQEQTAWQVRVASSKDQLESPDLWDSKKVQGNQSTRIKYAGKALESRMECWWQVKVWDKEGKASKWSEPAYWHMGLLSPTDWKAQWIGAPWQGEEALPKPFNPGSTQPQQLPPPAPMFRKSFNVTKEIKKAVAYCTGLGYFELYLNGAKVGNDVLVPNQTNYTKRPDLMKENIPLEDNFRDYKVMYLAYDLTDQIKKGENVVGSILGNGFYNPSKYWAGAYGSPRFIAQLYVTYADGTEDVIISDQSWKAAKSPILMDMVYYGEHYDATKEQDGWNKPGFDDSTWQDAVIRKAPTGRLVAHTAATDKVTEQLSPKSIQKLENGNYKVEFGVEVSGWVRLKNVEGPAGHKIEIKYLSNQYSGDNSYIFNGKGKENYAARFNWFVFSGVEIANWPGELKKEQVIAEVVHTQIDESARFETSNTLFNDITKIWKRSQTDNMHGGIASDCPHRERSPYTGDGQVSCVTVMHNYDARNFYYKWIQDILGAQNPETGYVPNSAPWQPGCGGGVAWGSAMNIMPWEFYLHYGDKDMLEDNYEGMKGYIRYMQKWVNDEGIMHSQATGKDGKPLVWMNLGDWCAPDSLPANEMVHTFYFWRCADITAKTAAILGKKDDADRYATLAENTRKAFYRRFYNPVKGTYSKAGGNIFALKMGVPADQYPKVTAALKEDIKKKNGHLDTGIFGTQFFFEVLADNGLNDLAYEAMNKKDAPSYGHWLEMGSTTSREEWGEGGSHNHPMFGGGLVWLYRKLAGMNADPDEPGYRHIIFKPQPVTEMNYVRYYNITPFGEAGIQWNQKDLKFSMEVTVPVGAHATVYVPAGNNEKVTIDGKFKSLDNKPVFLKNETGYQVYSVKSGKYNFRINK